VDDSVICAIIRGRQNVADPQEDALLSRDVWRTRCESRGTTGKNIESYPCFEPAISPRKSTKEPRPEESGSAGYVEARTGKSSEVVCGDVEYLVEITVEIVAQVT
jgi:hypothetical protein